MVFIWRCCPLERCLVHSESLGDFLDRGATLGDWRRTPQACSPRGAPSPQQFRQPAVPVCLTILSSGSGSISANPPSLVSGACQSAFHSLQSPASNLPDKGIDYAPAAD